MAFGTRLDGQIERARKFGWTGEVPAVDELANYPTSAFEAWLKTQDPSVADYIRSGGSFFMPEYYTTIQKYKDSNPYIYDQLMQSYKKYQGMSFAPTSLQSIGEFFGDYSARQNFENQINSGLGSEIQRILEGLHEEDYTDPSAELSRRKQAGINDDLSGASQIGSGSPAGIDQPDIDNPVVNDGSSSIPHMAQLGVSFVSSIISFGQGIQNLHSGQLANVAQDMANHESAMGLIMNEVINTLGISEVSDIDQIDSAAYIDVLRRIEKDNSFNSSTKRVLSRYIGSLKNDNGTAVLHNAKLQLAKSLNEGKMDLSKTLGSDLYDKDFEKMIGKVGSYFNHYVLEASKIAAKAQMATDKNTIDYNNVTSDSGSSLGTELGKSDVSGAVANQVVKEQLKLLENTWNDIYKAVQGDHWYNKVGMVLLPMFRAMATSMLQPSVSFGASFRNNVHDTKDVFLH